MKLLALTNRNFFIAASCTVVAAAFILFFVITGIIQEETDDAIMINNQRIREHIHQQKEFIPLYPVEEIKYSETVNETVFSFSDTVLYDPVAGEEELFRQLISEGDVNGKGVIITTRSKSIENKDVLFAIIQSIAGILIGLLLVLYLINRSISKKIWAPFYSNLEQLKSFSITQNKPVVFTNSNIEEFNSLNNILISLTVKMIKDYNSLKKFTENASHEIQTPLAIIKNKVELLMQTEELTADLSASLETIYQNTNRLSRLNEDLILLTKIDNRQYSDAGLIDFNRILHEYVSTIGDLVISANRINITESGKFTHYMNSTLAFILIKNLIENALKYTIADKSIEISCFADQIIFSNAGQTSLKDPVSIFNRFAKEDPASPSLGLGLAIVHDICAVSGLSIAYSFENGMHRFVLRKSSILPV